MLRRRARPKAFDPLREATMLVMAVLLLSYPWLSPALQRRFFLGVPLVVVYLFAVWGGFILLAATRRTEA